MFKFLKEKLKNSIKNISSKIEEEGKSEEIIVEKPAEEKKSLISRIKERFSKKEDIREEEPVKKEEKAEDKEEPEKEEATAKPPEKEKITETDKKEEKKEEVRKEKKIAKEKETTPEKKKRDIIKEKKKEEETVYEKPPMRWDVALHKYVPDLPLEKGAAEKKQEEEKQEKPEKTEEVTKEPEEKKGLFGTIKEKITTKKISREQFEKIFWDMEVSLLENNIAVEVIEKIKEDLTEKVVEKPLARGKIEEIITGSLAGSIREILKEDSFSLIERVKEKKPFVVCFVGINGSGKTPTIAKVAKMLLDKGLSVVLAASDTFRAASIEQLQLHADKLGVKLIKHNYGSDPAAVAFDAVKYAKSKSVDVVLIDTAGRIHSNVNLKDEMKKIIRISKPDLKIFVGESITGNDCVEQAKNFNEAIGIDGIILSKADIDEKGGAAVSVSYVTKKPIIYIGTGQEYKDLKEFDSSLIVDSLGIQ